MTRQIGLLRGINVGRHNRIGMSQLRELCDDLGFEQVRTHLQSGNIAFNADTSPEKSARRIESGVAERFGTRVPVLVRTRDELVRVIDENPLREVATDPARLLVIFLSAPADKQRIDEIDPEDFRPDVFAAGAREIYLWCPNGLRTTALSQTFWEKRLDRTATGRNWNTVTKLLALADS